MMEHKSKSFINSQMYKSTINIPKNKKKNEIKYSFLLINFVISGLLLVFTDHVLIHIISMLILSIGAASIVKFDFMHPYVWYSIFFTLYSISYPVLYFSKYESLSVIFYTKELILTQWIGLVVFLLIVTPSRINLVEYKKNIKPKASLFTKVCYLFSTLVLILTILYISDGNYSNKRELFSSDSLIVTIGFKTVLLFIIFYSILLINHVIERKRLSWKLIIFTFSLLFLMFFFSGERDLILKFVIVTFYIYYLFLQKLKHKILLFIFSPFLLLLVPFLKKIKYYGLTGEIYKNPNNNIIIELMTSDFSSASMNMQILLLDSNSKGLFKGYTIIMDLLRGIELPLIKLVNFSTVEWFNNTYFPNKEVGMGFSIVGEGYVNFGYLGIILIFAIIGYLVKILYKNSVKGFYGLIIYILSIPTFIYSIRADLANILSPLISQLLLSIGIIVIIEHIFKKLNLNKK